MIQRIAVLGAGTMGAGIAQVAALAAFDVTLFDPSADALQNADERIQASLTRAASKKLLSGAEVALVPTRLKKTTDLKEALADRHLVIESVPEDLALKQKLFKDVAALVSETTVLATNTSGLPVTQISRDVPKPERVIGMHFFNPPLLLKLLELIRAEKTSDETLASVKQVGERMGREIIIVKDSPGFATSRLGIVIALEAMRMVESGVASAEDIDKAMEHGYKHQMGPLRTTDLVGLDVRLAIAQHLHQSLGGDHYKPPAILERLVREGKLGKKSGQGFFVWNK